MCPRFTVHCPLSRKHLGVRLPLLVLPLLPLHLDLLESPRNARISRDVLQRLFEVHLRSLVVFQLDLAERTTVERLALLGSGELAEVERAGREANRRGSRGRGELESGESRVGEEG